MKSQSVQLSHYVTEVQNDCLNYFLFGGLQFLCERGNSAHQRSVLLRTGLASTKPMYEQTQAVCEGKMLPVILAQG